jgi:nucleotide-binding universal stress UspA family protein
MKKILCPIDFSEAAQNATAYAAKLAQLTHAELTLLNVQSVFDMTPADVVRSNALRIAAANEQVESVCREVERAFRISCTSDVESSARPLSSVIHDWAKHFDLVVMGTDGPDDLYQFFSGSNTYNALAKVEVPVLLVPAGYGYQEIKRVVYAFDYWRQQDLPLTHFIPIVRELKFDVTILQVMETSFSLKAEQELEELQQIIRNFYGSDLKFTFDHVHADDIASAIDHYVQERKPDALALCSQHRNLLARIFHHSVIKHITAFCRYPVFVFHA